MKNICKALPALMLMLLPFSAAAQAPEQVYTIQKGDTLWGISERFIKDPYYWPNLWANNPFVTNPHFIYPGQQVAIRDGRLVLLPGQAAPHTEAAEDAQASAPDAPTEPPIEPVEEITVKTVMGSEGFVTMEQLDTAGTLVDANDDRILLGNHDQIFVEIENPNLQPGDRYALVDVGEEVKHPVGGEVLGHRITTLGEAEILSVDGVVATAVISKAFKEVTRGARLIPQPPVENRIALKKAAAPLAGYVIANNREKIALSQQDVIYVDLGAEDGLEVGNMLYLSRPRQKSRRVMPNVNVTLPDQLLGAAVVLDTRPHTAAALILKSVHPIYIGDWVSTPAD